MIKTLQITGIAAAVAAVFLVFPVVFGVRGDEQIEKFLKSTSAIEEFGKANGEKGTKTNNQTSPLVKQAKAFAMYLNPPVRQESVTKAREAGAGRPRPLVVSVKFKLIGTSLYESNPEFSLALIDEPGTGLRWVRQSSVVGRLTVEQIKDGVVVIRDGEKTFELAAERPEKRSLVRGSSMGEKSTGVTEPDFGEVVRAEEYQSDVEGGEPEQDITEEEAAAMAEKIFAEMEAMQTDDESDKTDSERRAEEDERAEKIVSKLRNLRITGEEAGRLDDLGKELEDIRQEPNQDHKDANESDVNSVVPDSNEPNAPNS